MLTNGSVDEDENGFNIQHPMASLIAVTGEFVFKKGETFGSYEDVVDRLEKHQKESFVYYWRRDSRTVERAFTKTSRILDSRLKYYTVHFACVFGGQKFQARGSGKRPRQRVTNRVDCPANIFFRAAKCGKLLEVISVCNLHNHQISEELSALLPQNRKISEILKEEVAELLNLKVDRKKIIEYVKVKENKNITSKDLFNLSARLKTSMEKKKNFNDRTTILNRICTTITDDKIKVICKNELSNIDNEFYSIVETEPLIEYIPPINVSFSNEAIIKSNRETIAEQTNADETIIIMKPEDFIQSCNKNENLSIHYSNIEELNHFIDSETDSSICKNKLIDDFIVEEENETHTYPDSNTSPIVVLENYSGKEHFSDYISQSIVNDKSKEKYIDLIEYENIEESNKMKGQYVSDNSEKSIEDNLEENCTIILYETTTDQIVDGKIDETVNNENHTNDLILKKNNLDLEKSVWKSRRKINKCNKCGSKTKLLNMQIKYLKAQRKKLFEETKLLKMKRKILKDYYFSDEENVDS